MEDTILGLRLNTTKHYFKNSWRFELLLLALEDKHLALKIIRDSWKSYEFQAWQWKWDIFSAEFMTIIPSYFYPCLNISKLICIHANTGKILQSVWVSQNSKPTINSKYYSKTFIWEKSLWYVFGGHLFQRIIRKKNRTNGTRCPGRLWRLYPWR